MGGLSREREKGANGGACGDCPPALGGADVLRLEEGRMCEE